MDDEDTSPSLTPFLRYIIAHSSEYSTLRRLREQGWKNPAGDSFFARQRHNADHGPAQNSQYFFKMMREVGRELQERTDGLTIHVTSGQSPSILDMCMAPGGFLSVALDVNPTAEAMCFSLPPSEGGHNVAMCDAPRTTVRLIDITFLAEDMGRKQIPSGHPDAVRFLPKQVPHGSQFDLAICDGHVLRTHSRAAYRDQCEATRLISTQLALSLEHLRDGGTMIILLHKLEAPHTAALIHTFSTFASIQLFKPHKIHASRSSFYLVASNTRSTSREAQHAIGQWKASWDVATFQIDNADSLWEDASSSVPESFWETLVRLGTPIWHTQGEALRRAPWNRSAASSTTTQSSVQHELLKGATEFLQGVCHGAASTPTSRLRAEQKDD